MNWIIHRKYKCYKLIGSENTVKQVKTTAPHQEREQWWCGNQGHCVIAHDRWLTASVKGHKIGITSHTAALSFISSTASVWLYQSQSHRYTSYRLKCCWQVAQCPCISKPGYQCYFPAWPLTSYPNMVLNWPLSISNVLTEFKQMKKIFSANTGSDLR